MRSVILVEPENPLNIGFVARAMKCSGVTDLRIVTKHTCKMDDKAFRTGTSAKEILSNAKFYPSLEDAMTDFNFSVAFSRRTFTEIAGSCELSELPQKIYGKSVAFVFGRESQGLFRHELVCCSVLCHIPLKGTMSYNLGQAVAVALYETDIRMEGDYEQSDGLSESVSAGERKALFDVLANDPDGFLEKGNRMIQLRKIISKINLSSQEIALLIGTIRTSIKK